MRPVIRSNHRSPTAIRDSKGFTTIEVIIAMGISVFLMGSAVVALNQAGTSIQNIDMSQSLWQVKQTLLNNVLSRNAMIATINDPANLANGMGCLVSETGCSPSAGGSFRLLDQNSKLVLDATNSTAGFTVRGQPCTSFNSVAPGNRDCPVRYDLRWKALCKPSTGCIKPMIEVTGTFVSNIEIPSLRKLNAQNLHFNVATGSPSILQPKIFTNVFFVNQNSSMNVNVLSKAWVGPTPTVGTASALVAPLHGTATLSSAGQLVYTPTAGYAGIDYVSYTVTSSAGAIRKITSYIKVMTPYTWTGDAASDQWTSNGNWCGLAKADHSGCVGGAVPDVNAIARFDDTCWFYCTPQTNGAVDIRGIYMNAGFAGTLTQSAGNQIRVRTAGFTQEGGQFYGSNAPIIVDGDLRLTGGSFQSTSARLNLFKDVLIAGASFAANGGETYLHNPNYDFGQSFSVDGVLFHNLTLSEYNDERAIDLAGTTLSVSGLLKVDTYINHSCPEIMNGVLQAFGDVSFDGSCGMQGTAKLKVMGNPAGQTVSGTATSRVSFLEIAAGANQVRLVGAIRINNQYRPSEFRYTSGVLDTSAAIIEIWGDQPFSLAAGNQVLENVILSNDTSNGDLNLNGGLKVKNLTLNSWVGENLPEVTNGDIEVYGNLTLAKHGMRGTARVKMMGNPAGQTISGVSTASIPYLEIAAGANVVNLAGIIRVEQALARAAYRNTSGSINAGSSELIFTGGSGHDIYPGTAIYNVVRFDLSGDAPHSSLMGQTLRTSSNFYIKVSAYHSCGGLDNGSVVVGGLVYRTLLSGCSTGSATIPP